MIEGYVGLIGGGKSLNATDRMMHYIAGGGVVYTNMSIILDPWYNMRYSHVMKEFRLDTLPWGEGRLIGSDWYLFSGELPLCIIRKGIPYSNSCGARDYLRRTYQWEYQCGQYNRLNNEDMQGELHSLIPRGTPEKPVLCVLDEAVDFFDTDDRSSANREFLSFLRHSRKQAVDMIFIAQDFTELNKRIRNQTHFIWTFWDMQTFKIPGLRSTLPPPWKNMILCQQWNRNMTGGPLKRVWKTRDVGLFGCYRTDELFRALKSADGKTDFSGEGKIIQGESKMKLMEKIALFLCLLFSGLQFFGKNTEAPPETESPERQETAKAATAGQVDVNYGRFRFFEHNGEIQTVTVDGIEYSKGRLTSAGVVLAITRNSVHILDDQGKSTFIYPDYGYRTDIPEEQQATARPERGNNDNAATANAHET